MANQDLLDTIQQKFGVSGRQDLGSTIDQILTEPQQDTLFQALTADAIDATPVIGDAMVLNRQKRADELGVTYPDRPAAVENALSDLPPPLDTLFDIIIAQNTMTYVEQEQGIPVASAFQNAADQGAEDMNEFLDSILDTGDV